MSRAEAIEAEAAALLESIEGCDAVTRAIVAGSIRRRVAEPRDIEIVVEARWAQDLLGNYTEHGVDRDWVDPVAIAARGYDRVKGGGRECRYVQLAGEFKVDLFIAAPDNYGLIVAIRTGPAEFSRALASRANQLGMHMHGGRFCTGYRRGLDNSGACVAYEPQRTPEEDDVFRLLRVCWVSPPERNGQRRLEPSGEAAP